MNDERDFKIMMDGDGYFNGNPVVFFTVWRWQSGAWVHFGKFLAPKRTPRKKLLSVALSQI